MAMSISEAIGPTMFLTPMLTAKYIQMKRMAAGSSIGLSNIGKVILRTLNIKKMSGISSIEPLEDTYRRPSGHWTPKPINHQMPLIWTTASGAFNRFDVHLSKDFYFLNFDGLIVSN